MNTKIYKKSLGQNFLRDPKILKKIADFAYIEKDDTVLEIGPGEGTLTKFLLERAGRVIAVEKDRSLVNFLKEKFTREITDNRLEMLEGDILDFEITKGDPLYNSQKVILCNSYKLLGNIPYNITGEIFRKFLESEHPPSSITFVIQKEVAERIVAKDQKESVLSISVKAYGEPELGGIIKAGSFVPAPKVDSCIISIRNINKQRFNLRNEGEISEKEFFKVLKAGFAHKRKLLLSNLLPRVPLGRIELKEVFEKINISPKARAEDLSIDKWFAIITACQAKK